MNSKIIKVLILDDERYYQDAAKKIIEQNDMLCAIAPDIRNICKAVESGNLIGFVDSLIKEKNPKIVLTDIKYLEDEMAGFDIASYVSEKYPEIKVIGMTSSAFPYDNEVKESGMFILLDKNYNFAVELVKALNKCA